MEAPRCTLFFKPWYAIINANFLFFFYLLATQQPKVATVEGAAPPTQC